jgi:HAD superfamily hydrolase (TIGR01549 family)
MSIPEVIFWDFDGVILNSMPIRDKGFLHIFKEYPAEKVAQLLDFHHQNGGLSRYVKIRYFYEKILQEPISEEKVMELAQEFSHIMRQELANTELLIEDSLNFIKKYHSEKKFHIVSGSDEKELQFLCKELGIADYFVSIHGSPTPKKELVSRLIQAHGYSVENCVLIGDSINDYEAAVQNGINFWGYNNEKLRNLGLYIDKLSKQ